MLSIATQLSSHHEYTCWVAKAQDEPSFSGENRGASKHHLSSSREKNLDIAHPLPDLARGMTGRSR